MRVVCSHCALPFSVARSAPGRPVYCCSGCALAARVPVDASGQFPVNAALVTAFGVGFAYFNQVLFWLLAVLVARAEGGAVNSGRFAWMSVGLGALVWGALAFFQIRAGARRRVDYAWIALGAAAAAYAVVTARLETALVGNAVLAAWTLRGLIRSKPNRLS